MTYYVYELIDPRSLKVFYVGKGKGPRIEQHEKDAKIGEQSEKCTLIREIIAADLDVIKNKVKSFRCEQQAYDFEAELICQHGIENLTNIAPGGGTARDGHSVYEDRADVACFSRLFRRTRGTEPAGVAVLGHYVPLSEFFDSVRRRVREIIERRGLEWVNSLAQRYGVEYQHA